MAAVGAADKVGKSRKILKVMHGDREIWFNTLFYKSTLTCDPTLFDLHSSKQQQQQQQQ